MAEADEIAKVVLVTLGAAKVLSAPAEAVGEHLKERIRRRLERTLDKARDKGMGEPISDRVAVKVLNEAAFTDDDLTLEYLAGVMAASGTDDTGAATVAQIGRLSAIQLRIHYVIYRELRRLWPQDIALNLYQELEAQKAGIRIPLEDLFMSIGQGSPAQLGSAIPALIREGLLHRQYAYGPDGDFGWTAQVRPSGSGAELFLYGHGERDWSANRLFDRSVELTTLSDVPTTPSTSLLTPPEIQEAASS